MDQFTKTIKWETYYQDPAEGHADTDVITITDICPRCAGHGYIPQYGSIKGGICFECYDNPVTTYETTAAALRAKAKKRAQGIASRARTAARKRAKAATNLENTAQAWANTYPAMIHFADAPAANLTEWETHTLASIRDSARRRTISDKQATLAARIIQAGLDRAELPQIKKPSAPMGKHEVTGTITNSKVKDTNWGPTVKITVTTEEGWKVYATCPKPILFELQSESLVGAKVAFNADLEPSSSEDLAFASRPAKARVL